MDGLGGVPVSVSERPQRKTVEAFARVRALLEEMRRGRFYADFHTIASRAKVSRRFLYKHRDLTAEIDAVNAQGTHHLVSKKANPNNPLPKEARDLDLALRRLLEALGWTDLEPGDLVKLSDGQIRALVAQRLAQPQHRTPRGQAADTL